MRGMPILVYHMSNIMGFFGAGIGCHTRVLSLISSHHNGSSCSSEGAPSLQLPARRARRPRATDRTDCGRPRGSSARYTDDELISKDQEKQLAELFSFEKDKKYEKTNCSN